jgi:hypothetical protein
MSASKYSSKVLELVARETSGYFTGNEIVKILEEFGLKRDVIQYPNTKWWTINEAFRYIKENYEDPDGHISKLIMDFLHPLQHNLNSETSERLANKVKEYLKYDNFYIENTGKKYLVISSDEMEEIYSIPEEVIEQEKDEKKADDETIKEETELIKTLRDNHQLLMDVVEIFCQNTKKPTKELNDSYLFLSDKIEKILQELNFRHYKIFLYKPFQTNLYSAETEWDRSDEWGNIIYNAPILSWDTIRPSLYKVHSEIIEILNLSEEDKGMVDEEKRIQEIITFVSQKRIQKENGEKKVHDKTMKIEISKMPELNIKNVDNESIVKGKKKIALPRFSATAWHKVQIRFIDENNVYITADKNTATADYEGLGFRNDKNGKPNTAWKFLLELAKNNGETPVISSPIPDAIKNQKRVLSDRLKTIFKNDTDPFNDFSQSKTYKIKIKLIPPSQDIKEDKYGIRDYLDETMTSQYYTDE